MNKLIKDKFKSYTKGLKAFGSNTDIAHTKLQIITGPVEALWAEDLDELSVFAGYVPDWSSEWSVRNAMENSLVEKYQKLLSSLKDKATAAEAISKFKSASKSMVESPHHPTLAQFTSMSKTGSPAKAFKIVVREGSAVVKDEDALVSAPSIVRSLEQEGDNPVWNDLLLFDEDKFMLHDGGDEEDEAFLLDEDEEMDEGHMLSTFLGRRRRRRSSVPPLVLGPIYVKSERFHMEMSAQGLAGIVVGIPGVDRSFIRRQRTNFNGNWFGRKGQFALMPSIVWVVMRPEVVLRLSESEFVKLREKWNSDKSLGVAVGGIFFRNANYNSARQLIDIFPQDVLEDLLMDDGLKDKATVTVRSVDRHGDETVLEECLLEDFDFSSTVMHTPDSATFRIGDDVLDTENEELEFLEMQDDEAESHAYSELFGRRRRRRGTPPPPPPPPTIHEKVYEVKFTSESVHPHVIAVTSDIL